MYTFENFYELPLNEEAQECEVGKKMFVDQLYTFGMVTPPRYCLVLEVRDSEDGRRVVFQEL